MHAKLKRTAKTKCCVRKTEKRCVCVYEKRSFAVFETEGYRDVLCLSTAPKMTTTNVEVQCKNGVKTKSKPDAI